MKIAPPITEQELMERANKLTGITLQQLANRLQSQVPDSMKYAKGWIGNILERALGANAANSPKPDFVDLGIELKTIPIDGNGIPKESTYICVVQLDPDLLSTWERSLVKKKLSHVLWVPIEATKDITISMRRIGKPVLWKPDDKQETQLRNDWQELCDIIAMGELDKLSSSMGKYLQIRPKAANAKTLTIDKNQFGNNMTTLPRGFYLRSSFTRQIISSCK